MNELHGGTAVVTGGAGTAAGLGRGLVREFARHAMRVAILDRDESSAASFAAQLRATGVHAMACRIDVADHTSLQAAADAVRETFGACNILCVHVGIGGQGRFEATPIGMWREAFEVMGIGAVATIQAFLPLMRATSGLRRVVLTSSAAALAPGRFQGPYRAAKAAVTSIGETIDIEMGPEGIGATVMFPSGMAEPELIEAARIKANDPLEQARRRSADPVWAAIGEELNRDPTDLVPGEAAARPLVQAVLERRRYVITHGATVTKLHAERAQLLDEAIAELARRNYLP